ncbi:MAG: hypothetical protein IKB64_05200, partial [Paludibacteraceae bacterium]|nr:hypothetical protein [Paludibacteraceae bacterium]
MASSLLNTLKNIELGRQNIIHDLNLLGIPTEQNASFSKIGANLEGVSLTSNNKYIVPPLGTFYDNPEDDPAVWKKPESWPDIAELLDELVEADTKFSDSVCIIKQIIMFQTSEDTTIFGSGGSTSNVPLTDNTLKGFNHVNNISSYIMTNDGSFYQKTSSMKTITHTWDHSKDLIGPTGEHFKYIVTFTEKNYSTTNIRDTSSITNFEVGSNIKLNQILTNPAYQTWTSSSSTYYNGYYTVIPYHVVKYDMREPIRVRFEIPRMTTIRTDILIKKEEIQEGTIFYSIPNTILNTFYVKDIDTDVPSYSFILCTTAVYVRTNKLSIASLVRPNYPAINSTANRTVSGLKYFEIPTGKKLICTNKIMFPCIRDIDKIVYSFKNSNNMNVAFQSNTPILQLESFSKDSNSLKGVSARTLIIDDASTYNDLSGALDYTEAEVVVLNNLKTLSKPISGERSSFRVLIAPDLETISASLGTTDNA